jgi:hypothetical protein
VWELEEQLGRQKGMPPSSAEPSIAEEEAGNESGS